MSTKIIKALILVIKQARETEKQGSSRSSQYFIKKVHKDDATIQSKKVLLVAPSLSKPLRAQPGGLCLGTRTHLDVYFSAKESSQYRIFATTTRGEVIPFMSTPDVSSDYLYPYPVNSLVFYKN